MPYASAAKWREVFVNARVSRDAPAVYDRVSAGKGLLDDKESITKIADGANLFPFLPSDWLHDHAVSAVKTAHDLVAATAVFRAESCSEGERYVPCAKNLRHAYNASTPDVTSIKAAALAPTTPPNAVQNMRAQLTGFEKQRTPMQQPQQWQGPYSKQKDPVHGATGIFGHTLFKGKLGLGPGAGAWDTMSAPGGMTPKVAVDVMNPTHIGGLLAQNNAFVQGLNKRLAAAGRTRRAAPRVPAAATVGAVPANAFHPDLAPYFDATVDEVMAPEGWIGPGETQYRNTPAKSDWFSNELIEPQYKGVGPGRRPSTFKAGADYEQRCTAMLQRRDPEGISTEPWDVAEQTRKEGPGRFFTVQELREYGRQAKARQTEKQANVYAGFLHSRGLDPKQYAALQQIVGDIGKYRGEIVQNMLNTDGGMTDYIAGGGGVSNWQEDAIERWREAYPDLADNVWAGNALAITGKRGPRRFFGLWPGKKQNPGEGYAMMLMNHPKMPTDDDAYVAQLLGVDPAVLTDDYDMPDDQFSKLYEHQMELLNSGKYDPTTDVYTDYLHNAPPELHESLQQLSGGKYQPPAQAN